MSLEIGLQSHYGHASLLDRIEAGLIEMGCDPKAPHVDDLKAVDEFHTGGIVATQALLDPLDIKPGMRVLDIGCGIGGAARYIAHRYGARVTGVDLTPSYVAIARELTARVGLADQAVFEVGSALALPARDAVFDLATLFHVGMNIENKVKLFVETARALKPGGRFAVFDVMRGPGDEEIAYPVPWAPDAAQSFVTPPQTYRDAAARAGLSLVSERDRGDFARTFFAKAKAAAKERGAPPLGLHLLMGKEAGLRIANIGAAAQARVAYPWEMVFAKPG